MDARGLLWCAGFLGFFFLFFGSRALTRWFQHRERMAMIARGLLPNDVLTDSVPKRNGNGKRVLTWGIAVTAFGLALLCGLLPLVFSRPGRSSGGSELFLLPGLVIVFMGVALVIIHLVTRPKNDIEPEEEELAPHEPEAP
jgi:hypothetical protein